MCTGGRTQKRNGGFFRQLGDALEKTGSQITLCRDGVLAYAKAQGAENVQWDYQCVLGFGPDGAGSLSGLMSIPITDLSRDGLLEL